MFNYILCERDMRDKERRGIITAFFSAVFLKKGSLVACVRCEIILHAAKNPDILQNSVTTSEI